MKMASKLLVAALAIVGIPQTVLADSYNSTNYRPNDYKVKLTETNLPIVFLDTRNGGTSTQIIHKDYRIAVRMKIIDNANGVNYGDTIAHPGQTVDYEGWIGLKYRGNSSFSSSDKKPYGLRTLKTNDPEGDKDKVKLLGMGKDNDWVLLAPYADRSMIRDVLMYELGRPWFEYTPTMRHCELILDGYYYGVYILGERVRKGKHRLNLTDPGTVTGTDEITGDYQIEVDRKEDNYFISEYKTRDQYGNEFYSYGDVNLQYKFPEYDESTHEQRVYLRASVKQFEDALAADDFADPNGGYRRYMDVTSFIDQQLSQEASANVDGYRLSTNLYKRRDSEDPHWKTSLWDFNLGFGNADYYGQPAYNYWIYQNAKIDRTDPTKAPFWWQRMMEDPEYVKALKKRWASYRKSNYSEKAIEAKIDSMVNRLDAKGARTRNYKAWVKPFSGNYIWPVPNCSTVNTWEKEINNMKSWIKNRLAWMDKQLDFDPTGIMMPTAEVHKEIVGYYNLNGVRLPQPEPGIVIIRYKDGTTRKMLVK